MQQISTATSPMINNNNNNNMSTAAVIDDDTLQSSMDGCHAPATTTSSQLTVDEDAAGCSSSTMSRVPADNIESKQKKTKNGCESTNDSDDERSGSCKDTMLQVSRQSDWIGCK
jgi:hypothetical protein